MLRKISEKIINYDTVLFHGSAIAVCGKAYLFTAPSGTGKTTHTKLWLNTVPDSYVLNGDKPFLKMYNHHIMACGSPWQGKENYGVNQILPLEGICILERDSYNHIEQIECDAVLGTLIKQTYRPDNSKQMLKSLQLIGRIGKTVKLYRMGCNKDPEAAIISSRAMIQE